MNGELPQQYYYPAGYQPELWQTAFALLVDVVILVALGAWALSLVRSAIKGEEVRFPL